MKIKTFISVLALICLHKVCSSCSTCTTLDVNKQVNYAYKGIIVTKNAISDEYIAQWTVSGKLTVQSLLNKTMNMKLDDLKTSLFNGLQTNIGETREKEVMKDMEILSAPFILSYDKGNIYILYQKNEPLWSINMKKAIGDIFILDPEIIISMGAIKQETTIYGLCPVTYKVRQKNESVIFDKIINHGNCLNGYNKHKSNVKPAKIMGKYKPVDRSTTRSYTIEKVDGVCIYSHIESSSNLIYKPWPSIKSNQYIVQNQTLELLNITKIENIIPVSKNLLNSTIIIAFDDEIKEKFQVQDYIDTYYEYRKQSNDLHLKHKNVSEKDTVQNMYNILSTATYEDLQILLDKITETSDMEMQNTFYSYLPYIGTNGSNRLIKLLIKTGRNETSIIKLLALLPTYIFEPTDKLYKELEDIMDLEYTNKIEKHTAILSSASIFTDFYQKGIINNSYSKKNIYKYINLYEESNNHEENMINLLALVNIAPLLRTGTILKIIKKKPSQAIQSLAIYAFKPQLINHPDLVFKNFWPTVQNQSEYFEVRVAALDLLLSSNLSRNQFDQIISAYKNKQPNSIEQHLQNYLYTTLQSIQNTTKYTDFLSDFATETLNNVKIDRAQNAESTANLRISVTEAESNFGSSYHYRVFSNPLESSINTIQFSNNVYGMSLNLMTYSIYIKCEGFVYYSKFLFPFMREIPNSHLLNLIEKNRYKLLENPDFRIDLVLFLEDRAVFGVTVTRDFYHTYPDSITQYFYKEPFSYDRLEYLYFPLIYHTTFVSELGTPIHIKNNMRASASFQLEESDYYNFQFRFLSQLFLQVESYNPVASTTISSYKCIDEQNVINLLGNVDLQKMTLKWKNIDKMYQRIAARLIGTYVDNNTALQEYCFTCDFNNAIPNAPQLQKNRSFGWLGFKDYSERSLGSPEQIELNSKDPKRSIGFTDLFENIQSNFDPYPIIKPIVFLIYLINYNTYLSNDIEKLSSTSVPYYNEPNKGIIKWQFDDDLILDVSIVSLNSNKTLNQFNITLTEINLNTTNSSYEFRFDAKADNYSERMCLVRNWFYPNLKSDKFTIEPFQSTEINTVLTWEWGEPKSNACPVDILFNFTETFSTSEAIIQKVKETDVYKKCKKDAINLKYTPPTESCVGASKMITNYNLYNLNVDLRAIPMNFRHSTPEEDLENYELLHIERLDENFFNVTLNPIMFKPLKFNYREASTSIHQCFFDPIANAYSDFDVINGKSRTCHITSNYIKSFNEKSLLNYATEYGKEIVAFVECHSATNIGMTVQRLNDRNIGFTLWSYDDVFTASVANGNLTLTLNNKEIKRDDFQRNRITVLDDNVINIKTRFFKVYYNTEYISIKTELYGSICGVCKTY